MSVERNIRFDLIARLCPNTTGAELRSVATEAGMFAIRARRKVATERDFLDAVEKVVRQGTKFSSTYVESLLCPWCLTKLRFTDRCIKCIIRVLVSIRLSCLRWLCYSLGRSTTHSWAEGRNDCYSGRLCAPGSTSRARHR